MLLGGIAYFNIYLWWFSTQNLTKSAYFFQKKLNFVKSHPIVILIDDTKKIKVSK